MDVRHLWYRLGVFMAPNFVAPERCREFSAELMVAKGSAAGVVAPPGTDRVNEGIRRAVELVAPAPWRDEVQGSFDRARPLLAAHFGIALEDSEGSVFLRYEAGSFYRPHHDSAASGPEAGGDVTFRRRISAVLFLNQPGDTANGYAGGQLILYGLVPGEPWRNVGLPLEAQTGLLVAFPSRTVHEVTPVTAGCRLSVVNWFY